MPGRIVGKAETFAALARDLLKQAHIRETQRKGWEPSPDQFFPVPLRTVVEVLDWTLEEVGSVGHVGPGLEPVHGLVNFERRVIMVGIDNIPLARRNFTLAHEIGHIVLHNASEFAIARRIAPYRRPAAPPRGQVGWQIEEEANLFAAELLMPRRAIRNRFEAMFQVAHFEAGTLLRLLQPNEPFSADPSGRRQMTASELLARHRSNAHAKSLQEFFGVSNKAMAKRLRELGLVLP
jgi:Zn-dependent peptidase ImmA (M78 family)